MMDREAVIFDVDGTLVNVKNIRYLVAGKKKDFEAFHIASAHCPPNWDIWEAAMDEYHIKKRAVLIVTGREFIYMPLTIEWMARYGVPLSDAWSRNTGDYRPDAVIKREILTEIRSAGYNPVKAYDDHPKVGKMWIDEGLELVTVPGWDDPVFDPDGNEVERTWRESSR